MSKSYGQFCALARGLDHVGDRWTLLIVRELLLGPASYSALVAALQGIPTNLLAQRLREMEADGLVARLADAHDRRRVAYRLTPLGRGLEAAVLELIRWGSHWMETGPGHDAFDPRWAALALRALLEGRRPRATGTVALRFPGGTVAAISTARRPVRVAVGATPAMPEAVVDGDAALLLAVAAGQMSLTRGVRRGLRLLGNRHLSRAVLEPARPVASHPWPA